MGMFDSLNRGANQQPQPQQGMNPQQMMQALRRNPAQFLKNAGYNVPDEMLQNPKSAVMYLMQSGQVANPIMQRVQPMINRLMGGGR